MQKQQFVLTIASILVQTLTLILGEHRRGDRRQHPRMDDSQVVFSFRNTNEKLDSNFWYLNNQGKLWWRGVQRILKVRVLRGTQECSGPGNLLTKSEWKIKQDTCWRTHPYASNENQQGVQMHASASGYLISVSEASFEKIHCLNCPCLQKLAKVVWPVL